MEGISIFLQLSVCIDAMNYIFIDFPCLNVLGLGSCDVLPGNTFFSRAEYVAYADLLHMGTVSRLFHSVRQGYAACIG